MAGGMTPEVRTKDSNLVMKMVRCSNTFFSTLETSCCICLSFVDKLGIAWDFQNLGGKPVVCCVSPNDARCCVFLCDSGGSGCSGVVRPCDGLGLRNILQILAKYMKVIESL